MNSSLNETSFISQAIQTEPNRSQCDLCGREMPPGPENYQKLCYCQSDLPSYQSQGIYLPQQQHQQQNQFFPECCSRLFCRYFTPVLTCMIFLFVVGGICMIIVPLLVKGVSLTICLIGFFLLALSIPLSWVVYTSVNNSRSQYEFL